jgi:glycosyltransferase involved in cell wall biosynthesis
VSTDQSQHSRPFDILHVIPSVSAVHGGPSRAIVAMERALTEAGVNVTTATTDDDGPGQRLRHDDRVADVNGATRIYVRKWSDFYKVAPGLIPWLWHNVQRFDVVHIHAMFSFTSIAAGVVARLRRVPYIVRPLGTLGRYGVTRRRPWLKRLSLRLIEGPILRGAAYVHCTSEAELEEAWALGLRFNGGVIPLGVEQPLIHHPEWKVGTATSRASTGLAVLYLSRIDRKKNIEGLLSAFAIVARDRPDVILQIAGDGPAEYVAVLKAQATSLSIERRVEWLGHIEGDAKAAAFAAADVFVLPSYSENFGIAAVEAMLAGLPCILGEGVGIAGEVRAAAAGCLVAPEPHAIAVALAQLLDDGEERERMGQRALTFARREYSTATMAQRLMALYASLIQSLPGRHA